MSRWKYVNRANYSRLCLRVKMLLLMSTFSLPLHLPNSLWLYRVSKKKLIHLIFKWITKVSVFFDSPCTVRLYKTHKLCSTRVIIKSTKEDCIHCQGLGVGVCIDATKPLVLSRYPCHAILANNVSCNTRSYYRKWSATSAITHCGLFNFIGCDLFPKVTDHNDRTNVNVQTVKCCP
jgi:hypothetical protein